MPNWAESQNCASKVHVENIFSDPSIKRNSANVDLNDKCFHNVEFDKTSSLPAVRSHSTPKLYVDGAISKSVDESSLLTLDTEEEMILDEQDSTFLNCFLTSPKTIKRITTKPYGESLSEIARNR